jgi:LysR family transcriptional regulator, glycine cleavage system transcriptional activator
MPPLARLIPSPRSLMIFEAAARAGSCSGAAREFNLTQPSVSRNIAQLETHLGFRLFSRSPAGLELTEEGRLLHTAVAEGLQRVEAALIDLAARRTRHEVVDLSLSTAFVTHWFIPRMQDFYQAFPSVDLRFQLISGSLRGAPGDVDLAMRRHGDEQNECHSWHFAPEVVVPVCSPAYLDSHGPLDGHGATQHRLLHFADPLLDWSLFWGELVDSRKRGTAWVEFTDYAVVVQAAMNGEGIAPGWLTAISRALAKGTLVPASNQRVVTGKAFHLLAPRQRPLRDIVLAIRNWMTAQMRDDMAQIADLLG